jgi:hypothetical protein
MIPHGSKWSKAQPQRQSEGFEIELLSYIPGTNAVLVHGQSLRNIRVVRLRPPTSFCRTNPLFHPLVLVFADSVLHKVFLFNDENAKKPKEIGAEKLAFYLFGGSSVCLWMSSLPVVPPSRRRQLPRYLHGRESFNPRCVVHHKIILLDIKVGVENVWTGVTSESMGNEDEFFIHS